MKAYLLIPILAALAACSGEENNFSPSTDHTKLTKRTLSISDLAAIHNDGVELVLASENDWDEFSQAECMSELFDIIDPYVEDAVDQTLTWTRLSKLLV